MGHLTVEPVYDRDVRVGSRVWDGDIELEESDLRFRAAVCGKTWRGDPPVVTDADTTGIVGGKAVLKRAVSSTVRPKPMPAMVAREPLGNPSPAGVKLPSGARDEDAVSRAAARLAMLRAKSPT